jgi:hypothetical protein
MTNKVYRAIETAIRFKDTDATYTLALKNLAAGAGRISDRVDRGAGSLPAIYRWKGVIQWETAPAVGEYALIYLSESDGTNEDGDVGTSDGALTSGDATNLEVIGLVKAQTTDAAADNIASGMFMIYERYFSIGVWNASAADNLENTDDASWVEVTPMPDEIQ